MALNNWATKTQILNLKSYLNAVTTWKKTHHTNYFKHLMIDLLKHIPVGLKSMSKLKTPQYAFSYSDENVVQEWKI